MTYAAFISLCPPSSFLPSKSTQSLSYHRHPLRKFPLNPTPLHRQSHKASLSQTFLTTAATLTTLLQPPSISPHVLTASTLSLPTYSSLSTQLIKPHTIRPHQTTRHYPLAITPSPPVQNKNPIRFILPKKTDGLIRSAAKISLIAGFAVFVIVAATISVFWIIQDSLVYKPTKVLRGSPSTSGMPYYDDVSYCTIDGAEISGWFIKQPLHEFKRARTLLYFHGTDKNASFRLKKVMGFYELCKCNILLLSYRGYGLSTGKPNERGMRIDAESAYDYLLSRGDIDVGPGGNLWVYGESLGGAVAIYFSNLYQHCINALILENTFTSLLDMIKLEFPILGIFRYLSRNRWQSKKRIGDLGIPLLFLSGLKDSYIPPQMMQKMHSLATKSPLKEFVKFEKGTHNRTWTMDGFYEAVASFMNRVEKETPKGEAGDIQGGFDEGKPKQLASTA